MTLKAGIALILILATNAFADSVMAPSVATGKFLPARKPTALSSSLLDGNSVANQNGTLSGGNLDSAVVANPVFSNHVTSGPTTTIAAPRVTAPVSSNFIPVAAPVVAPVAPIAPIAPVAPVVNAPAPQTAMPSAPSMPIPDASLYNQPVSLVKPFTGVSPADYSTTKLEGQVNQPCLTCQAQQKLEHIPLPKARPKIGAMHAASKSYNGPLSDGQCAMLMAAKQIAPHRDYSVGLCGIGVSNIIAGVERRYPGFDNPRVPLSGRYPVATPYSKGFEGFLRDRNWTPVSNLDDAPPGTVVIFRGPYSGANYRVGNYPAGNWVGHVTVKGDDGLWYTDGRTPVASPARNRYFKAAFMPGPSQNAAAAGACDTYKNSRYNRGR